ncbi:MAG: hypothetical protein ISS19_03605 [Bacteroidales bacterium]|nr:hypothetical protein [Bacteroidales bacterium]
MNWKLILLIVLSVLGTNLLVHGQFSQKTGTFHLEINSSGQITRLSDTRNDTDYLASETGCLIGIKVENEVVHPVSMKANKDILEFSFANGTMVSVKATNKNQYLRFEILALNTQEEVGAILWGPIKTTISETVGEFVGVVRNKDYAIGIQALNVKTTGGELVNDEGGVFGVRGSAAVARNYGSSLQTFCIDRSKPQLIKVWNQFERAEVMASPEFNLVGSAIALFGTPAEEALELIGHIEVEEGLPHILIDGEWGKASPKAGRPYIISSFGEETVDQMLDFTESVGFYSLYHSHPFSNW